jgi:hypothetical protein
MEWKKGKGKAIEFHQQLPILAQGLPASVIAEIGNKAFEDLEPLDFWNRLYLEAKHPGC